MQIGCVIFGRHPMSYSLVEVRVPEQRSMRGVRRLTAGVEKQNIAEGSGPTTPTKGSWARLGGPAAEAASRGGRRDVSVRMPTFLLIGAGRSGTTSRLLLSQGAPRDLHVPNQGAALLRL